TRINRPAVDGRHITSISSPTLCPCQGLPGQPGGTLVGPAWTVRKERIEKRRRRRTRRTDQADKALGQIPRGAVARVVNDSRNGRGADQGRNERDLAIRHFLPPERTARAPGLSSNRVVGENLPRVFRERRRRTRAAWRQEYAGSLPCQRHDRDCGSVAAYSSVAGSRVSSKSTPWSRRSRVSPAATRNRMAGRLSRPMVTTAPAFEGGWGP